LPAQLRLQHVPIEQITLLTSTLVLPWTLKFLWAPLVDLLSGNRWTLKHWVFAAQLGMALCLVPLFFVNDAAAFSFVGVCLFLHSLAAATQDVAIDALAIHTIPSHERGRINGWMQMGMLFGRSLFGGISLVLIARVDPRAVLALLIAAILSSALLLARSGIHLNINAGGEKLRQRLDEFVARLTSVAKTRGTWLGFVVALFGGAAFEGTGAVAGPFLVDRGFSAETVGMFFGFPVVLAMMGGSLLGGAIADRLNKHKAVMLFVVFIAAVVVAIALSDLYRDERNHILLPMLTLLYFGIGLFTAASYAFFMEITEPQLAATQFSAFMGATNLCEAWSALLIGRLIGGFGYPAAFVGISLLSLVALPALAATQRAWSLR
jgi:MFS family permease